MVFEIGAMIVGSLHIRGGGSKVKRKSISQIIAKGNIDIFLIQESKLALVDLVIASSLWNNEEVWWSFSESEVSSGSLITLWKMGLIKVISSLKERGFLGIKVAWKRNCYYVVNVYSLCSMSLKRKFWNDLLDCKSIFENGEWCMGADFNSIANDKERYEISYSSRKFWNGVFFWFIDDINLIDMPYKGNKFSWFSDDGNLWEELIGYLSLILLLVN